MTLAWLGAFVGLLLQATTQCINYAASPTMMTVAPWYPERLPELKFCPSEVWLYRKVEVAVLPNPWERAILHGINSELNKQDYVTFKMNALVIFLDSLFPFGQFFWFGRFSSLSTLTEEDHLYDTEIARKGKAVHSYFVQVIDAYLERTNSTVQDLVDFGSLSPRSALQFPDDVRVRKHITSTGVCYLAEPMSRRSLGTWSYTIAVRTPDYGEVHPVKPRFDVLAVGEKARSTSFRGLWGVSFPGQYTVTVTPIRFSKISTTRQRCSSTTLEEQAECSLRTGYQAAADYLERSGSASCRVPSFDGFLSNGVRFQRSSNDRSVADLCSYFFAVDVDMESVIDQFVQPSMSKSLLGICPIPCQHVGYNIHMSVERGLSNQSTITVQYGDLEKGLSYTQSFTFPVLSLVSVIGGINGVWIGASFVSILQAMFYGVFALLRSSGLENVLRIRMWMTRRSGLIAE